MSLFEVFALLDVMGLSFFYYFGLYVFIIIISLCSTILFIYLVPNLSNDVTETHSRDFVDRYLDFLDKVLSEVSEEVGEVKEKVVEEAEEELEDSNENDVSFSNSDNSEDVPDEEKDVNNKEPEEKKDKKYYIGVLVDVVAIIACLGTVVAVIVVSIYYYEP